VIDGPRDRREALVLAAYRRLADAGFEGLRTRDVAADAGINVATLHYHFPTKEALIRAVVNHTMRKFAATLPRDGTPSEQLRGHLRALRRLVREEPELWSVLGELALRAARDPVIAAIVGDNDDGWHRTLHALLRRGVEQGDLPPGLDPDETASAVMATLKGVTLPTVASLRPDRVDQTFDQLERWLGLSQEETR
jgi:TetR/AcrR family transcriptional repressor of nem operon